MADAVSTVEPAEASAAAADPEVQALRSAQRRMWLIRLAMAVAIGTLVWLAWYLVFGRNYVSTDNAYINAEVAQVTPLLAGPVTEIHVKDTQFVHRGDVLVVSDQAKVRIALDQALADLAGARRRPG